MRNESTYSTLDLIKHDHDLIESNFNSMMNAFSQVSNHLVSMSREEIEKMFGADKYFQYILKKGSKLDADALKQKLGAKRYFQYLKDRISFTTSNLSTGTHWNRN